jgi:hypothetical protein
MRIAKKKMVSLKGRPFLGDRGIHERMMLKRILKLECEVVDWIHLAQVRVCWQILVNVIIFGFHKRQKIS